MEMAFLTSGILGGKNSTVMKFEFSLFLMVNLIENHYHYKAKGKERKRSGKGEEGKQKKEILETRGKKNVILLSISRKKASINVLKFETSFYSKKKKKRKR